MRYEYSLLMSVTMACWQIWKEWCNQVFQKMKVDPERCIGRINNAVEELLQMKTNNGRGGKTRAEDGREEWKRPERGWVKVNCDGAFKSTK